MAKHNLSYLGSKLIKSPQPTKLVERKRRKRKARKGEKKREDLGVCQKSISIIDFKRRLDKEVPEKEKVILDHHSSQKAVGV